MMTDTLSEIKHWTERIAVQPESLPGAIELKDTHWLGFSLTPERHGFYQSLRERLIKHGGEKYANDRITIALRMALLELHDDFI
jgi:hypothetical protein